MGVNRSSKVDCLLVEVRSFFFVFVFFSFYPFSFSSPTTLLFIFLCFSSLPAAAAVAFSTPLFSVFFLIHFLKCAFSSLFLFVMISSWPVAVLSLSLSLLLTACSALLCFLSFSRCFPATRILSHHFPVYPSVVRPSVCFVTVSREPNDRVRTDVVFTHSNAVTSLHLYFVSRVCPRRHRGCC